MALNTSQLPLHACAFLLLLFATATTAAPSCPPSKAGTTYGERYTYLEGDIAAAQKEGKGAPLANPLFAAAAAYDLPRIKCLVEQVCFCVWVEGLFHERWLWCAAGELMTPPKPGDQRRPRASEGGPEQLGALECASPKTNLS